MKLKQAIARMAAAQTKAAAAKKAKSASYVMAERAKANAEVGRWDRSSKRTKKRIRDAENRKIISSPEGRALDKRLLGVKLGLGASARAKSRKLFLN